MHINIVKETDPKELADLAESGIPSVKMDVAKNVHTPKAALRHLSKDENSKVRSWVAANPSTSRQVLMTLSKDADRYVRWAVAQNPNTPSATLSRLAKSGDKNISKDAADTISKKEAQPAKFYNHMVDVAFSIVSPHKEFEDIDSKDLVEALQMRATFLRENPQEAVEAFGDCGDAYEVEAPKVPNSIKVIVSIYHADGHPDFYPVKVKGCTAEEVDRKDYLDRAKLAAHRAGHNPFISYEDIPGSAVASLFSSVDWAKAPEIGMGEELSRKI